MKTHASRSGFTLIELLVVIVIIAVLAGLIFPVFNTVKRRGVETRTVSNLRQIGTGISSYCNDHDDMLPGPLTVEQYPVFGDDPARDKGSLAKLLAPYLSLAKKEKSEDETKKASTGEFDIFNCPGATAKNLDEVPGYIMNVEEVPEYNQPAWGKIGSDNPPLRRAALTTWRDNSKDADGTDANVVLAEKWAMRHTDKKDAKEIGLSGDWIQKLPEEPVFNDHYQALYFDWHVATYVPEYMKLRNKDGEK